MFEIIGLLIGTFFLFVLASLAGFLYAFVAWLILRPARTVAKSILLGAALIPIASAAYMWICVAVLPGESLFSDIDQPLPNGYRLKGLGKMPEYSSIEAEGGKTTFPREDVGGVVESLSVNGPLVAGKFCHTCIVAFVGSKEPYFVLDTRTGATTNYPDLSSLEARFGQPVRLTETRLFRSEEANYRLQERIDHSVMFTPPILFTVFFFAYLIRRRRRESQSVSAHLY